MDDNMGRGVWSRFSIGEAFSLRERKGGNFEREVLEFVSSGGGAIQAGAWSSE